MTNGVTAVRARSVVWRCTLVSAIWLAATAAFGAAPAAAADAYESKLEGLPDRFQVGGEPGVLTVSVTRRAAGCARIRALMLLTLPGIDYGHLKVEVRRTGGGWENSPISRAGDDIMRAEDNAVEVEMLCAGQSRTLQHRIAFLRGAPAGTVAIDAVVSSHGDSAEAGRVKASRPVVAGAAAPRPSSSAPRPATPSRTPARATASATANTATTGTAPPGPQPPEPSQDPAVAALPGTPDEPGRPVASTALWAGGTAAAVLGAAGLAALLLVRRRRTGPGSG